MQLENVQKIAVLRANAIGDFIFAVPAYKHYAKPTAKLKSLCLL
jgi:ADP-heptose:LPS heptosyltransferase